MSEITFIKCLTEFENFYVSRLQSNHNIDQTRTIAQRVAHWSESTLQVGHIFSHLENTPSKYLHLKKPKDRIIQSYQQRDLPMLPVLRGFLPSKACRPATQQENKLSICAKSAGSYQP